MIHGFISKVVFSSLLALSSLYLWINPPPVQPKVVPLPATMTIPALGGFTPVQAQKFKLAGAGVISSATSITLQSFKLPDASTTISMSDLGTIGYGTIEPGTTKEEQISFTGVVQNANGTATLTGVSRGLDFRGSNCTATLANQKPHAGSTIFVLSNTACSYSQFVGKDNAATITGIYTFGTSSIPRLNGSYSYGVGDEQKLVTYGQLASTSFSGTVNASPSQKGIVQIGTPTTTAAGTATGSTGAILVPPGVLYNSTSSATTTIPVTNGSGKLSSGFIDQTATYSWTGSSTLASTTVSGQATFNGATIFNGAITGFPTTTLAQVGKTVLASATSSIAVSGIPARQQLYFDFFTPGLSASTQQFNMYFNSSSTVPLYGYRYTQNGGASTGTGSSTLISVVPVLANTSQGFHSWGVIENQVNYPKYVTIHTVQATSTTTGANAYIPDTYEVTGYWNSTAQISSVTMQSVNTGNWNASTTLTIYASWQ